MSTDRGVAEPWETRERVVVALTGAPGTEVSIRRAARIAGRGHGELVGVHVTSDEGRVEPPSLLLDEHRKLLGDLGGEYHEVAGGDVAVALVGFARAENATQLVLGVSQRARWAELVRGSVINRVIRLSGPIDVHVISHERPDPPDEPSRRRRRATHGPILPPRRRLGGWALAFGGVPLLTLALAQLRDEIGLPTVLLLFLALVVLTATVGGRLPALIAAIGAFLAANWFFTPPLYRWHIAQGEDVVALGVFLGVALAVSRVVNAATSRAAEAARARSEARTLASMAATMGEDDPLPTLLAHLRSVFGLDAAALVNTGNSGWDVEAAAGEPVPQRPDDADVVEELSSGMALALVGARLAAEDHGVLNAFAGQLAAVLERSRLRVEAGRAHALAEANALRSALLQAVSHDLRTPLASIKASASSLCQDDVQWSDEQTAEFVRTINDETDRLTKLVGNLLDMSRIQAGVLQPALRPTALEEVLPAALDSLGPRASIVDSDVADTLPPVRADAPLLERALANVIDNAVRYTSPGRRVRIEAGAVAGHIDVRVIDQGPGIPRSRRDQVFQPFQRLGDNPADAGVGLGLAVAHGFLTAIGATIELDDTPGGGTTALISIATAE